MKGKKIQRHGRNKPHEYKRGGKGRSQAKLIINGLAKRLLSQQGGDISKPIPMKRVIKVAKQKRLSARDLADLIKHLTEELGATIYN